MNKTCVAALVASFLFVIGCSSRPSTTGSGEITVFAAASTTDVLLEAGKRFEAQTGNKVTFSFDASSNLAKQIKAGSPADILLSADEKWMSDVAQAGGVRKETIQVLLGNSLVMIAPADRRFEVSLERDANRVVRVPDIQRLALGDPSHVPAGRYAKQALESLGWWSELGPRVIPAQDVRAALRLVEIGEADAGIVYATDTKVSGKVVVVASIPSDWHEPIRYPIAQCTDSKSAADFIQFLRSPDVVQVFEQAGFQVIRPSEDR